MEIKIVCLFLYVQHSDLYVIIVIFNERPVLIGQCILGFVSMSGCMLLHTSGRAGDFVCSRGPDIITVGQICPAGQSLAPTYFQMRPWR